MDISLSRGVNRSKRWSHLIKRYVHDSHESSHKSLVETIKDLMYFAALLGFSLNKRVPLEIYEDGIEDIQAHVFSNDKNIGIIYAIAVAVTKDSSVLKEENEKQMIEIFEEYANGGFEILETWQKATDNSGASSIVQGLDSLSFLNLDILPAEPTVSEFENFTIE